MTIEALGTALIVAGVVLGLVLGLPLVVGIIRLDASNRRLVEYAAQLAGRGSRSGAGRGPTTLWDGVAIPFTEAPEDLPRRLTVSSSEP